MGRSTSLEYKEVSTDLQFPAQHTTVIVFGDEKVALIDNVYSDGMINQLNARIEDAFIKEGRELKIDVFIQCHTELDHSIGLRETIAKYPSAEVYASQKERNF